MSKDWYQDVKNLSHLLCIAREERDEAQEAIERLAEFASEMASDREDLRLIVAIQDEERIERLVDDSASLWRHLCHSRAVQLNEAYNTIAWLRDELIGLRSWFDKHIKQSGGSL